MTDFLIVDLETHGQSRFLDTPWPDAEAQYIEKEHGSLKDPAKIIEWKAKQREAFDAGQIKGAADWREARAKECALTPRLGRIIGVGVLSTRINPEGLSWCELDESKEKDLVSIALDAIETNCRALTVLGESNAPHVLVTFNGLTFDLPFLHIRAAVHGIPIPWHPSLFLKRYTTERHADLRAVLSNWDMRAPGSLDDYCDTFGIPNQQAKGSDIAAMVAAGDREGIMHKNLSDLRRTAALAQKLSHAGLI